MPGPTLSVVNAGLGGNHLLESRPGQPYYGIPALARVDHDVFTQAGVRDVILLEGVNDIGFGATVQLLLPAYNSGDHLHPHDAGGQAMANAINLRTLLR